MVSRVDVGPTLALTAGPMRLQADWRQKVTGNARPDSGPVATLSVGF